MHFWIDKRSQTCGFSGRHRVPSSLSAGGSRPQIRSTNSGVWGGGSAGYLRTSAQAKPMVTPVHRFQSIESVASATAVAGNSRVPRHHQSHRNNPHLHGYRHNQQQLVINVGSSTSNDQQQSSANSHNTHRNVVLQHPHSHTQSQHHPPELDNRVYLDVPNVISDTIAGPQLAGPMKVKCSSMWITFGLITLFAGGARLYLSNQDPGIEVLVFAMFLVMALVVTCYVGVCRAGNSWVVFEAMLSPQQIQQHANGTSTIASTDLAAGQHTTRNFSNNDGLSNQVTQEEITLNNVLGIQQTINNNPTTTPPPPPPPYHIAILLPQQPVITDVNSSEQQQIDESPPPSYDKIIR
ncbi:uncharacterized protein LOC123293580 [Chrysoperla carnea]|uniref:uncharacterized protein LOC123293580 n=1 Tax=Chrysoperla carnea TaxID=189513 RepID=UPI001D06B009|nr:uncharacterized protein LOC123293580 [Chrysoperla carnea]